MTEDTKATLNNMKNSITATGKKVFSPNHLKKGAVLLIVLAIIGAGGKYFVHQNKVEAKTRAMAARTTLLQNMAAQNNISLVSTDDVKNKVADALGKEVSQINFKSVNLVSPTFGKDGEKEDNYKHEDKHEKNKKDKKEYRKDNDRHEKDLHQQNKRFKENKEQTGVPDEISQATPKQQARSQVQVPTPQAPTVPGLAPNAAAPDATASLPVPPAPPVQRQAPLFYSVKCSMDQVDYKFVVNAQDGKILRSEVEPAKLAFLNK